MKKQNVIMLVLDSITYENTLANEGKECPMPFIHSLMDKGINARKVYSEAPYTEAALVSLLCGDNTLDKTNAIIAAKKEQMETLEEYKKTLIYEYVTGKKRIKE